MLRTLSQPEAEQSRIPGEDQGPEKCPENPFIPALKGEEFRSREFCEAGPEGGEGLRLLLERASGSSRMFDNQVARRR